MALDPNGVAFTNFGGSLLDAGRRINRSGIGLSSNSRQALENFYANSTSLFNQLYTNAESSANNNVKQILALRSKYSYLVKGGPFDTSGVSSSSTGTTVNETA
ncbi:MAG: hypothetical protein DI551_11690 [Micavibrio aeruginosavorus]|uniref:Uncharacterized protein n=1 Tax=Micavibrio aeruginosavorus TaxID=349221 RepID=A0A2W5MQR3_9BACT|nr:MAG: hypothetical protein DI551_11690 [Micavibrio aeruginosavorus]